MAAQESGDIEVEEEFEDSSEYFGITEESNNEKILQGLHEARGIYQEKDAGNSPACQKLDELEETLGDSMSSSLGSKVLCDNCSNQSDRNKNQATEGSNVYLTAPIQDSNEDNLLKFTCEEQNGQREKYCAECKKPLRSTDSKSHPKESEAPEHVENYYRAAIEEILREMSDRESDARKKLETRNYENTEFLKKTETLQNDVNRRRIELKEIVDRHADSLLVEVDSWRDEVSKIQREEIETLRRYVDSLESYKTSCEKIFVDGSLSDIQQVAADLEKKGTELRQLPKDGVQGLFNAFRVSLKKTSIEEFLTAYYNNNHNNIVGVLEDDSDIQDFEQISEEKNISPTYDFPTRKTRFEKFSQELKQSDLNAERIVYGEDPALVGTLRTNAAEKEDKGILGVAFLDDELFVVSRESSEVEVFDCRRFIFSCELDLDCLLNPEDIGACAIRKCLYIMDRKKDRSRSEILRVDTDGNLIKRWSTGGQWGRISITPECNILLCMYKTTVLNEYTADGVLLRVIQFSPEAGLDHPRHAIKLTSGHYVVGHGETGDAVHRVVKVDANGKVVGSFCGVASEEEMMKRPFHLTADAEGQYVLVADTDNRRVLMLSNALELKGELLSGDRHGLRYPARICIDVSSGLLFVADNKVGDKRVLVFLMK